MLTEIRQQITDKGYKIPLKAVAMSVQGRESLANLYKRVKGELKEGEVIFNKDLSFFGV